MVDCDSSHEEEPRGLELSGRGIALAQLSEDLLLVAGTEQGTLPLQIKPLTTSDLLDTIAARYASRAEDAGIDLQTDALPDLTITGDRIRLEQAPGNLLDNGIRHANHTVTLTARADGAAVELRVCDDGTGFPAARVPHGVGASEFAGHG